jgi:hypothetical protein
MYLKKAFAVLFLFILGISNFAIAEKKTQKEFTDDWIEVSEDKAKKVVFNKISGCLNIVDKKTGNVWKQLSNGKAPQKTICEKSNEGLIVFAEFDSGKFKIAIDNVDPNEVLVTISPVKDQIKNKLDYPFGFFPVSVDDRLVLPTSEGIVVDVNNSKLNLARDYYYNQSGISMPFCGFVGTGGSGLMTLVETYDDFYLNISKYEMEREKIVYPNVVWLSSYGGLRYPRKIRYCLFQQGDYVAMCKRYRKFRIEEGTFKTLSEKARKLPNVYKLIGAANIYDITENDKLLDWLVEHDIKKVLYTPFCPSTRDVWRPSPAHVEKAKKQGYVVSRYDIYADIAGPEIVEAWKKQDGDFDIDFIHRLTGYSEECIVTKEGELRKGWPYPLKNGEKICSATRCSHCKINHLKNQLNRETEVGLTSRMLDVETAKPLFECYSKGHPMTRTDDRKLKLKLFDYLHSRGVLAGAEGGADWASHVLEYQEGCLTLVGFPVTKDVYVGATPYTMSQNEIDNQLNMRIRAPLRELVYNDSMFLTWRWNLTPNRWEQKEYWDDWDLLHILYDSMPIYVLSYEYIEQQGERFLESYSKINLVRQQIASSEMLTHKFLTKDKLLQKTVFANGISVIVNFSKDNRYLSDGTKIQAKSYKLYRKYVEDLAKCSI